MHPLTRYIQAELERQADPEKAAPMQRYMKTEDPFYGVQAGQLKVIAREAIRQAPQLTRSVYFEVIDESWSIPGREGIQAGFLFALGYPQYLDAESWPTLVRFTRRCQWWDSLDAYATRLLSPILLPNPSFQDEVWSWTDDPSLWMRRAALLVHLKHKKDTCLPLLEKTILKLAPEREFFIRKAIGWVLRHYSYTDPDWVGDFVEQNHERLSGLSRREALKGIQRKAKQSSGLAKKKEAPGVTFSRDQAYLRLNP